MYSASQSSPCSIPRSASPIPMVDFHHNTKMGAVFQYGGLTKKGLAYRWQLHCASDVSREHKFTQSPNSIFRPFHHFLNLYAISHSSASSAALFSASSCQAHNQATSALLQPPFCTRPSSQASLGSHARALIVDRHQQPTGIDPALLWQLDGPDMS